MRKFSVCITREITQSQVVEGVHTCGCGEANFPNRALAGLIEDLEERIGRLERHE